MVVVTVENDGKICVLIVAPFAEFCPFPFPLFPLLLLLLRALTKEVIDEPDDPIFTKKK